MLVTNHCHGLQPPGVLSHSLFLSYFCRNLRIAWPVPPNTRQCLCLLSENGGGVCSWRGKLLIIIPRLDANYCVRQKMHVTCSPSADTFRSSVQFSRSAVSDSLQPHESQHAKPPCPSPTSRVQPNPCPLSQWCHPTISSSVIPFLSCLQSFPTSGSFQMSQLFASGGQSIGVSASTSVLSINTQDWSHLGWTG